MKQTANYDRLKADIASMRAIIARQKRSDNANADKVVRHLSKALSMMELRYAQQGGPLARDNWQHESVAAKSSLSAI